MAATRVIDNLDDLTTAITGLVKGSAGAPAPAVPNTDYVPPNGVGSALTVTPTGATTASTLAARLGTVKDAANDFGAVGNGTADDTAAIQAAADRAKAEGGGIVHLRAGTFKIRRPIQLGSNVTLRGAGRGVTKLTKAATVKSLLTVNCNATDTTCTVANGALFAVGDAIHLYDTTNFEFNSTQGRITAVNGNVLTFVNMNPGSNTGANANYQTNRSAAATTSFPLIRNDLASVNIIVCDLTLDGNKGANDPQSPNVEFCISPIHWEETYRSFVERCEILNSPSDSVSDQANSGRPGATDGSMKSTRNTVRGCRINGAVRHGVHLGTTMDGAFIVANEITNCGPSAGGFGVFYCAYATNTTVALNCISGCGSGCAGGDDRDSGNSIIGNTIRDWTVYAIDFSGIGSGGATPGRLVITDNVLIGNLASTGAIQCSQPNCTISNNRIHTAGAYGILIGTGAHRCTLNGNVLTSTAAASTAIAVIQANNIRLGNNVCDTWANGIQVHECSGLVATGQVFTGMNSRAWWFTGANTDCEISAEQNPFAIPVAKDVAPVRFVYGNAGTNGANDPASAGDWNSVSGDRHNGRLVHWTSGGTDKISIFISGVGWKVLN